MFKIIVELFFLVIIQAAITPFIRRLAFVLGAVDIPNKRRVNKKPMPTLGGLGIFVTFNIGVFILLREQFPTHEAFSVLLGSSVIVLTGIIDDIMELKPRQKMFGIFIGSLVIYFLAGIKMSVLNLPFLNKQINLGWWSLPITIFWILALTNAVDLIDGLDGLADGVSMISLTTMGIVGYFFLHTGQLYIPISCFMLAACLLGFLPYNFHPAKMFLGDTGALYIGFMIAVFSLKGLKNVTFISMLVPVTILGVPITDTIYAMIRRKLNNQPVSQADKHHLHHQLMKMGLTHRQAVLAIYGISLIFSFISLLFLLSPVWGLWLLIAGLAVALELFVESIGLLGEKYKPLLSLIQKIINSRSKKDPTVEVWHLGQEKPEQLKSKHKKD
ncbi:MULTISPECIES: glycosyltransferase family 4 protein [Lactobacillus]|uniref:UDP-N-acetylglucosamine--dolichyl-phosphate N-acetylglucosaminephosphotransferase n=1 Tax=Lactobacillus apis TaxID=303541 RepID=A0A0F4LQR9_9LACO|nr:MULTISPECIES: MraY family glycosyltransferase [Lactobacillus]KJY61162.1 UDP-N-acetylglucosamine--dolichyl-phosphate N-acetylglucosaminephosphotransferase [Lactobacillus apis]MBC6360651.1 undecaprenyl/decaprenyl-phosphate alpha-N-acetylglucosaminyl 1-phosphate transferase [Lactobacillus apis]MBH9985088.1 undecaprenyl/decaprenyl-phosphate alpha-N-acetylglucosaminyl 1-phosphate transferase [Lactobacillus sp. M0390]MBI0093237.1 undecaprenyl/decaprenyl-phosphate alpha-N-acetylglucosaminyl 1-phosp